MSSLRRALSSASSFCGRSVHRLPACIVAVPLLVLASCVDAPSPMGIQAPGEPAFAIVPLQDLTLVDAVRLSNSRVRLAGPSARQLGAAWNPQKQHVVAFETEFSFQLTPGQNSNTDHGFAFVVQNLAADAIGRGAFAYETLTSSVAVAFDTRQGARIRLYTGGSTSAPIASSSALTRALNDGNVQVGRIVYANGKLRVSLNGSEVFVADLNLAAVPGVMDANSKAWVGFTASSRSGNGQAHDLLGWSFDSLFPVDVEVSAPGALSGITTVATNVTTGQSFVGTTDSNGEVLYYLRAAGYIFSAYRFLISDPLSLVVWPAALVDGTNGNQPAFTPVIWHPVYGSRLKTPSTLLEALGAPTNVGFGLPMAPIELDLSAGATVACTLLDPNGNVLSQAGGRVFGVVPIDANDAQLPPRFAPPGLGYTPTQLASMPRGFPFATTSPTDCRLPGAPNGTVVLESPQTGPNGQKFVYRASTTVGSGGDVTTFAGPGPEMVVSHWYNGEPFGDGTSTTDFGGAIVFGWEKAAGPDPNGYFTPGDRFSVTSQFQGQSGTYTLQVWKGTPGNRPPDATISASCAAKKCSTSSVSLPAGVSGGATGVSLAMPGADYGTVVWTLAWPGLVSATLNPDGTVTGTGDKLFFRIYSGSAPNPSDTLFPTLFPQEYLSAEKRPGRAESYILAGVM